MNNQEICTFNKRVIEICEEKNNFESLDIIDLNLPENSIINQNENYQEIIIAPHS